MPGSQQGDQIPLGDLLVAHFLDVAQQDDLAKFHRQLLQPRAEQVDALAAGDLGVEPEVAGHLADRREILRGRGAGEGECRCPACR